MLSSAFGLLLADCPMPVNIPTAATSATRCSASREFLSLHRFIIFHLWQMHHLGRPLGGGKFDPEHAASSAAIVLDPLLMKIIYTVGVLGAVYHLANGIWTFGITWGIWTSDHAQRRAGYVCAVVGLVVASFGMGSLYGMSKIDVPQAQVVENNILKYQEMS